MLVRTLEVAELISARAKRAYVVAQEDAVRKGLDPDDAVAGEIATGWFKQKLNAWSSWWPLQGRLLLAQHCLS